MRSVSFQISPQLGKYILRHPLLEEGRGGAPEIGAWKNFQPASFYHYLQYVQYKGLW